MRLVIVGTGHVFAIGDALRSLIHEERPRIVALELDPRRYQGLREREAGRRPSPEDEKRAGRVYRFLARYQEEIGESFGVQPGSEMLAAADAAQALGARIELIDRDAEQVVHQALAELSWRERLRFAWLAVAAKFGRKAPKQVESELDRYHQDPEAYLHEVGRQFPTIKRLLIDERNTHMAARLRGLVAEGPVMAVVGDGHVPGLLQLVGDLEPAVVRLKELLARAPQDGVAWRASNGGDRVGFAFTGQSLEGSVRRE